MANRLKLGLVLVVSVAAWARQASAINDSDKEAIRSLSNDAATEFQLGHYESARDKFARAYRIAEVPKLAVWAARANEKLGHLVAAYELYLRALSLRPNDLWIADAQQQAQLEAQEELSKLQPRIPKLIIVIEGASSSDVSVSVDNAQVPSDLLGIERYADPGQRKIVGRRGNDFVNETAALVEGEKKQIVLRFGFASAPALAAPAAASVATPVVPSGKVSAQSDGRVPDESPSEGTGSILGARPIRDQGTPSANTQRTMGWIGVGVGAAGLALGVTTGVLVAVKYGDLNSKCPNNDCHGLYSSEVSGYHTTRTLSTVGFVVGGIATAAGVTLLLTTPKEKLATSVGLWLSPSAAGIRAEF